MDQTIGPYRVEREIGRGGMGVVHLAQDTRLDRPVAIKALPAELAQDPGRLERFEREAKALASLSHPNLAGIFGVEEQGGSKYLILEYVDGETLAERLDRGPIPVDEAVELAIQIATGIEAAHEAGIIHRDLKPANIKITSEGRAKVLDFGLARTEELSGSSAGGASGGDHTPTATIPQPQHSPTIAGAILGTAAYMSPEQARGRRVDRRTDIWSFGVVLYEMLAGSGPFLGETAGDSMGAVLHKEISLDKLPAGTPPSVKRLVRRCLTRDKLARLQAIGDARVELQEASSRLDSGQDEEELSAMGAAAVRFWPAITIMMLTACLGFVVVSIFSPFTQATGETSSAPTINSVTRLTDFEGFEDSAALSPNGRTLLYHSLGGGDLDVFSLRVGGSNPVNLTDDSQGDDFDAAFSPDGERIAFVSSREGGGVFIMGATGENPRRLTDEGYDPAWSPDGRYLVYTTDNAANPFGRPGKGNLVRVEVATGEQTPIETRDPAWQGEDADGYDDAVGPSWSPDGQRIAFWGVIEGQRDLYTVAAEGGDRVTLTADIHTDWDPIWSADSRTIYFMSDRGGQLGLWSLPLDDKARPVGEPTAVMPGPVTITQAAISADGRRLVVCTEHTRGTILRVGFDPETEQFVGSPQTVFTSASQLHNIDSSPDGEWVTYRSGAPSEDIYVIRSDGSSHRRLTEGLSKDRGPLLSPDNENITYYSNKSGEYQIWQMNRDGTDARILLDTQFSLATPVWTIDHQTLAVMTTSGPPMTRFYQRDESGALKLFGDPELRMVNPFKWSTDGQYLLGLAKTEPGRRVLSVYSQQTKDVTALKLPETESVDIQSSLGEPCWIDGRRILGWDYSVEQLFLTDVVTGESRWIESPFEHEVSIAELIGGDTLILSQNVSDSDLWMIELDGAQGGE